MIGSNRKKPRKNTFGMADFDDYISEKGTEDKTKNNRPSWINNALQLKQDEIHLSPRKPIFASETFEEEVYESLSEYESVYVTASESEEEESIEKKVPEAIQIPTKKNKRKSLPAKMFYHKPKETEHKEIENNNGSFHQVEETVIPHENNVTTTQSPSPPKIIQQKFNPRYSNISRNLKSIQNQFQINTNEKNQIRNDLNINQSPLNNNNNKSISVDSSIYSSEYIRKKATGNIQETSNNIQLNLDDATKHIRNTFPSPVPNNIVPVIESDGEMDLPSIPSNFETPKSRQNASIHSNSSKRRLKSKKNSIVNNSPLMDENDDDIFDIPKKQKKQQTKKKGKKKDKEEECLILDDSDDEEEIVKKQTQKKSKKKEKISKNEEVIEEESEEEETKKKSQKKSKIKEKEKEKVSEEEGSDDDMESKASEVAMDEQVPEKPQPKKKSKKKDKVSEEEEEGSDDNIELAMDEQVDDVEESVKSKRKEKVMEDESDVEQNVSQKSPIMVEKDIDIHETSVMEEDDHEVENDIEEVRMDEADNEIGNNLEEDEPEEDNEIEDNMEETRMRKGSQNSIIMNEASQDTIQPSDSPIFDNEMIENESKKKKTPKKKKKKETQKKKKTKRKRKKPETKNKEPEAKKPRLEEVLVEPSLEAMEKGLRRSKRVKFKPLAWWANETYEQQDPSKILTVEEVKNNPSRLKATRNELDEEFNKRPKKQTYRKKKKKKKKKKNKC